MNLSISNIAWDATQDVEMYCFLKENNIQGLEIAPTRIFQENPYENLNDAKQWATDLIYKYNLIVPSMQSIWFGKNEKIFGNADERKVLIEYTKKAILFAEAIGCKNLVFGNPRNRDTDDILGNMTIAIDFFKEIGDFAFEHKTSVSLEPNPTIYNTRFMNTTEEAVDMVCKINSKGIKVNADLGAMIYNNEDINFLTKITEFINHIHVSEPGLKLIQDRVDLHSQLLLITKEYYSDMFISIEMGKQSIEDVKLSILYLKNLVNKL